MSKKKVEPLVLVTRPDKCPVCKGAMIQYPTGSFCPAEDPHPGGLFVRLDGIVAHRSIIRDTAADGARREPSP